MECQEEGCVDGWICGVDANGQYRDRCPSIVHMTPEERKRHIRWMKEGSP